MAMARKFARAKKKAGPTVPVPPQFQQQVENLRAVLVEARDLSEPFNYFHDALAAAPDFLKAGVPLKNPRLRMVVEKVVQRVAPECTFGKLLLLHFGDFWHGIFDATVGPIVLLYFEQEDVGLAGFVSRGLQTELIRFTLLEIHGGFPAGGGSVGQA